jgi:hypothetical protein
MVPGSLEPAPPVSTQVTAGIAGLLYDSSSWVLDSLGDALFSHPRNGHLAYVGTDEKVFLAVLMMAVDVGADELTTIKLTFAGEEISGSTMNQRFDGEDAPLMTSALVQLKANEYTSYTQSSAGGGGAGIREQLLLLEIDAGPYGILYHSGTSSASGSGWRKIGGTAAAGLTKEFSESAEWRLRYDGATTKKFRIDMFADVTGDPSSNTGDHGIYKNGTLVTESSLQRVIYMNPYRIPTHVHCFVELATNDYVEPWVNCPVAVSANRAQLVATPLPDDYGLLYLTISGSNTTAGWQKAPGTTAIGATVNNFSQEANNRLRYDGTATKKFLVTADVSYAGANNEEIGWAIYKNGTIVSNSTASHSLNRPFDGQESPVSVQCLVELATNDYVEVWFSRSSTESIDVDGLILSAQEYNESA